MEDGYCAGHIMYILSLIFKERIYIISLIRKELVLTSNGVYVEFI